MSKAIGFIDRFERKFKLMDKMPTILMFYAMAFCIFMNAAPAYADVKALVTQLIDIITNIFRIIGILLLVYSVGQLILAFKNEDADSKSRASSTLVVAAVLISLKTIVERLNLTSYIPTF